VFGIPSINNAPDILIKMFADITIHSTAEEKSPQKVDKTAVKKLANAQLHADKKLKRAAEKEIRQNDGKGQNR
jgi:hypothetical protein